MSTDFVIVIPARWNSGRLPGKPLIDILGKSMIQRTYERCIAGFEADKIIIATDDERIERHCVSFGAKTLMTSTTCLTGTDRVAEVARIINADLYINIQGDEPLFEPADIEFIVQASRDFPGEILNGFCEISDEQLFRSPTIPKVTMRPDGRLLYMSRGSIPTNKLHGFEKAWRQVCIYAFPLAPLQSFSACSAKMPMEDIEDIEILRFLELGYDVRMVRVSPNSIAVDTPSDLARVVSVLRGNSTVYC